MTLKDTLFIPLESVFSNDSLQYVYKSNRGDLVKQIVSLGDANENYVLVRDGLAEGDEVFLSAPDETDNLSYEGLEIYAQSLKEKEEREAAEKEAKEAFDKKAATKPATPGAPAAQMGTIRNQSTSTGN